MKDKIISFLFVGVLFIVSLIVFISSDDEISFYERRKLTTFDEVKEDFVSYVDDYLSDQFPFRDEFISINSVFDRYLLMNKDKNDVYIVNDYLIEKNYPMDMSNINGFIDKINYMNDKILKDSNVFISVIPDKSYFLSDDYLKLDFDYIIDRINNDIDGRYIDIFDDFMLSDYYFNDIHLKQDSYFKVLDKFNDYLDFGFDSDLFYKEESYDSFYGASISKVGSYIKSEKLSYFSNYLIQNAKVSHLEYGEKDVYDIEKLDTMDSYNVFLSGPSALMVIENDQSLSDKELIIFRDSFASSFASLLVPYYSKITLIDLRYIDMSLLTNYVDFNDKDVLILYSTLLINASNLLKIMVQ